MKTDKPKFTIIEVKEDRIIIDTGNDGRTAIARYDDDGGTYFYNEQLKKQYVKDTERAERPEDRKQDEQPQDEDRPHPQKKGRFTYDVVTANKYGEPSRHYRKTIKADTAKEAEDKLEAHYKNIFDSELVRAEDAAGNKITGKRQYHYKY